MTADDMAKSTELLWADPLYDKSYIGVCDLTRASISMHASEIPALVSFFNNPQTSSGRWAVIVSEPKSTALGMLFKASAVARPWIEIFTSWESACAFLQADLPPSIFEESTVSTFHFGVQE